jgi:hypothetical protein
MARVEGHPSSRALSDLVLARGGTGFRFFCPCCCNLIPYTLLLPPLYLFLLEDEDPLPLDDFHLNITIVDGCILSTNEK